VRLLRKHRGNINRMAQESGKQRVEIYRMLKRCGLSAAKYRIEPETHS
jgi:transcriptional regulator of acetoin/glycerol metabolism